MKKTKRTGFFSEQSVMCETKRCPGASGGGGRRVSKQVVSC